MAFFRFLKSHKKAAWLCFFVLVYAAVLIWKFYPLVSRNELLPGNDTLGHFLAFHEFYQSLAAGHFWNYSVYWFGGMPLFQFYAPLTFLLMGGLYALLGHFVSQFLIFRWNVFLAFAIFPWPFYLFVKHYVGEKAAHFSLPVSLLLVFYPPFFNFLGLGAASSIVSGLFDEMLAVDLLLFYLVALKKLVDSDRVNWKWTLLAGLALAAVFLSHTLTSIMAGFFTAIIGIFFIRRWFRNNLFWNLGGAVLLGFLLSAFWLVPFIANLRFTSAAIINTNSFLTSALSVFAPFRLNDIWNGGVLSFPYVWILAWVAFAFGLFHLLREKKALLPVVLLITFLAFGLDYFNAVFPNLTLHYYRMLGYGLIFFLAIVAAGAAYIWEKMGARKTALALLAGLGVLLLFQCIYFFRFSSQISLLSSESGFMSMSQLTDINYLWSISDFRGFTAGNSTLTDLRSVFLPEKPERIMPDMSPLIMTSDLSSIHFFNAALPLANQESSIFGLYAESAWQLPFIFPDTNVITGNGMLWGRVKDLAFNQYFNGQGLEDMVKRLQLFGVNYLVTNSDFYDNNAKQIKEASFVRSEGNFKIYHLDGARPLVYSAAHLPGLFVAGGGALDFREFALGWYSASELLDYPIADWTKRADDLTTGSAAPFSFIALETNGLPDASLTERILSLGKPVVFLNEASSSLGLADEAKNIREIDNFRPITVQLDTAALVQPNVDSLKSLSAFVRKFGLANKDASTVPDVATFSGENVAFSGTGPAIVNLSYFPYWQCASGCDNVYPVTPGQMLVFASGPTSLVYRPGEDTQVGLWLSVLGLAGLAGLAYLSLRERKK